MAYNRFQNSVLYHSLEDVRKLLPGTPHISTIHRWRLRGVRGIKLQTLLIGGRRYVTDEALQNFLQQINPETSTSNDENSITSTVTQNMRHAEGILDREGV